MNKNNISKILVVTLILVISVAGIVSFAPRVAGGISAQNSNPKIKNVIMLVPDGCSQSIQTITRLYTGKPLNVDEIVTGTVSTWMSDSVITDSAPAATAFATGHKSTDKFLSIGPRTSDLLTGYTPTADPYEPIATVLEGSKLEGKATGLVSTSVIAHATPAAFVSHIYNRALYNDIIEQMVYQDVDVVFGGGYTYLFPTTQTYTTSYGATWTGSRTDGEDLRQALLSRGYQIVDSKTTMETIESGKVWGLFDDSDLDPEADRAVFNPQQPSLADMTEKAIQLLSEDKDGFFLMVEGSQVDWANHANDPIYAVTDFLAFDEAVGVAMKYAEADGHTLVLAFPDHNTGGLTIGNYYQDTNAIKHGYVDTTIEDVIYPLKGMKISSTGLVTKLKEAGADPKQVFQAWWGISVTDQDIATMRPDFSKPWDAYSISEYISEKYTVFGWTTHGHCGDDVPLWAYGPKGTVPVGHIDNTELASIVADALGFSLSEVSDKLFVDVNEVFSGEWTLNKNDPKNPVLEISSNGQSAFLPISKDLLVITKNGSTKIVPLDGVIVYSPIYVGSTPQEDRVYINQQVVTLLK
jgi:alkaline phosphatase